MEDIEDVEFENNNKEKPIENIQNQELEDDCAKKNKKKDKKKKDDHSEELEQLQEKYDELNDKYLRLFSEFDNFRKRTIKERIEQSKVASEGIIKQLLQIIDDFERALNIMEGNESSKADFEGIQLIYNKLKRVLQLEGLEVIDAMNHPFDTDLHEAITNIPAPDESLKGKVVDVIQKGYTLNGKVIRFARVVVGN